MSNQSLFHALAERDRQEPVKGKSFAPVTLRRLKPGRGGVPQVKVIIRHTVYQPARLHRGDYVDLWIGAGGRDLTVRHCEPGQGFQLLGGSKGRASLWFTAPAPDDLLPLRWPESGDIRIEYWERSSATGNVRWAMPDMYLK